jgi:programmed cell death protein 5
MDGDAELQILRAKRMQEMQQKQPQDTQQAALDQKHSLLSQILNPQARERLSRIRIVKQDKAMRIEEIIIRMAQSGQIRGKVTVALTLGDSLYNPR